MSKLLVLFLAILLIGGQAVSGQSRVRSAEPFTVASEGPTATEAIVGSATAQTPAATQAPADAQSAGATRGPAGAQAAVETTDAASSSLTPPTSVEAMFATRLPPHSLPLRQFGYGFFRKEPGSPFLTVGDDYVVGAGDLLVTYLWGDSVDIGAGLENRYELQVDRNGFSFFPPVGNFPLSGMTIQSIRDFLKSSLGRKYRKFDLSLTLEKMRRFPIYVSGFVDAPGPVMATAVDSVYEIIARAGGVMSTGSLRTIQLTRRGEKSPRILDLYETLVSGRSADLQVREGDSILVRPIGAVVAVAGAVKRPAVYELDGEKRVSDLLSLAGGLLPSANPHAISVVRFDGDSRRLVDRGPTETGVQDLELQDGDLVRVEPAKDILPNAVEIEGAVLLPGAYSIETTPNLHSLLDRAKLLLDTDCFYGRIYRTRSGGYEGNLTFQPREILDGITDVRLEPADRIVLYPFEKNPTDPDFDRFRSTVTMEGPVRYAGKYAWNARLRLKEILTKENLLLDTNVQYAEILRREVGSDRRIILPFSPLDVAEGRADPPLMPLDRIRFFPQSLHPPIEISGSVIETKTLQYYEGVDFMDVLRIVSLAGDPSTMKAIVYRSAPTAASLRPTGEQPESRSIDVLYLSDLLERQPATRFPLRPGDRIVFAATTENEKNRQITLRGQVAHPGVLLFHEGMRLSDAIRELGGYTPQAYPQGLVLLRESTATLQREQLDRAAKMLELTLQQNIENTTASLSNVSSPDAAETARLQIEAQRAELKVLRSQIADVLGRVAVRVPATLDELTGSPADLPLDEGDSIFIPRRPNFVQIIGEVFNPMTVGYRQGLKVRDYLASAGGTTDRADMRSTYLIHADGTVVSARQKPARLFQPQTIEDDPVSLGDTIVVAKKEVSPGRELPVVRDVATIIAGFATTALAITAIVR